MDSFKNITVEDLLPHRGRMKLVDDIIELDERRAVTRAVVTDQWPLFDKNGVNALALVELAAQTAGLSNGLARINKRGKDADNRGWLAGIKESRLLVDFIPLGAEIITVAENCFEFGNYREISGSARIASKAVGHFRLQVVGADDSG